MQINKDSRILDVAAGTGIVGQKVITPFSTSSQLLCFNFECPNGPDLLYKKNLCNVTSYCNNGIHG